MRRLKENCGCHTLNDSEITWQSTPVYDEWGWWGEYWTCADWITWHEALKAHYGINDANIIFILAFHEAGFGAASFDCRTFDYNFKEYAKQNGFFDALFDGLTGIILQPVSNVIHGSQGIGNLISAAVKYLPIILIVGAAASLNSKR